MENSRFPVPDSRILVFLYLFSLSLRANILAVADNKDAIVVGINREGNGSALPQGENADVGGSGGYSGVEISELCNIDIQGFLPPPYGNISGFICKPIWNTFILRVSFI